MCNFPGFNGVRALSMYLEYDYADNSRKTDIINTIPSKLVHAYEEAGTIKQENVRELLLSGAVQDTTLIQTEFYNTVMQGAEPVQCMRNFLPIVPITTGNSLQIPVGSAGAYADDIPEGNPITPRNNQYDPVTITVGKVGDAPLITDEMIKDSKYGLIALEVQKSGRRVENKFNRNVMQVILGSGLQTHDTTGSNQGITAVLEAQSKVGDYDYIADKVVAHPRLAGKLLSETFPAANYSGYSADSVRTGQIANEILGMQFMKTAVNPSVTGKTWGYSSDGYYGGVVADSMNFGIIVIREDIQVENFRDPLKQIQGATTTMRFKAGIIDKNAACAIIY
jgi:hypothetical protein